MRNIGKLLLLVIALAACYTVSSATDEDRSRLAELNSTFGDGYVFSFKEPMYLRAVKKSEGAATKEEAVAIFDKFRRTADGKYRESGYVYLNVYDTKEGFTLQVYYDPNTDRVRFSQQEYY